MKAQWKQKKMSKEKGSSDSNRPSTHSIEKGYKPDPKANELGYKPNPKTDSQPRVKLPTPPPSSKVKNDKQK